MKEPFWHTGELLLLFFVLGAFLIKFLPSISFIIIAIISIIFGMGLFVYGTKRFLQ